jgi:replicative DNA helicase
MSEPQFSIEFENQILAASLRDEEFLRSASRLLQSHHFSTKQHGWLWGLISKTWIDFAELATPKIVLSKAKKEFDDSDDRQPYVELASKLFHLKPTGPKAALAELQDFVRAVTLQSGMEEAAGALEKGKLDKAVESLRKVANQDFRPKSYVEVKWIEDFEDRQVERKREREHPELVKAIPTGIKRLDEILSGGARPGEVGLIVGTTGRGKSITLTNFAFNGVARGYGGIYFSLEMAAKQVATRVDSRAFALAYKKFKTFDFTNRELEEIQIKLRKMKKAYSNKLRVVSMPLQRCDVNVLRMAIEEIRQEMPVDFAIIDSGDHMRGVGKFESTRLEQAHVYWGLKSIADELQVAIWSSTQAGREWESRTAGAEAVSESYDKARIADIVGTLNQPKKNSRTTKIVDDDDGDDDEPKPGELDRYKSGAIEFFLAKYRDGESKEIIPLEADLAKMMIRQAEREGAQF